MCGIMGIAGVPGLDKAAIASYVERMRVLLRHRGPDEDGAFYGEGVGLGHTRLSILDIEHGRQPMESPDGSVALVFNGEIYNYRDLWHELELKGRRFRSHHSDTEVILNGYLEWGMDVFSRLDGMFALGIWDNRTRSLVLARDRSGIKPLYFAQLPRGGMVFASEPKAIVRSGLIAPSFDVEALPEYFTYRAVAAPRTFWRGISKLPAAHVLSWPGRGAPAVTRYWAPRPTSRPRVSMDEAAEVVEAELTQAVKSHLVADVPVGVFLSGGVDSSLVAAMASRLADLRGFTIGTHSELDETPFAAEVARRFGMKLHNHYLDPGEFLDALDDWVYFNDDPVSDPSALALLLLSRLARQHGMKVMLAGEGGDELFCGYGSYVRYGVLNSLRRVPFAFRMMKLLGGRLDGRTADYLDQPGPLSFLGTAHLTTSRMRRQMFPGIPARSPLGSDEIGMEPASAMRRALLFDQLVRLPNDILARTDRATMATGIEARVPFLDRRVIEAANALDDECCLHPVSFETKRVLKHILRKYLPAGLVYRKKLGFDLPVGHWLRSRCRPDISEFLADRSIPGMDYSFWAGLYEAHCARRRDYAAPLWAWLVLERWYRRWVMNAATGTSRLSAGAARHTRIGVAAD
jgi:asparagine synthase (glutamine-hydrolysing)